MPYATFAMMTLHRIGMQQIHVWRVQVKGSNSGFMVNGINGTLLVLLFFITIASSISAVRYIVVDSTNYHVFANL